MNQTVSQLLEFFEQHPHWVVLTGAGVSAASGIPTYRNRSGQWLRNRPIQHQEFCTSEDARRRYWGRSMVGWPAIRDAAVNENHLALTALEQAGHVSLTITQNVDRLHQRAGTREVIDLHGRLDRVRCLDCGAGLDRQEIQRELERLNPEHMRRAGAIRPDGDADLTPEQVKNIQIWDCPACAGLLKPDVVFFGGSIPRARIEYCESALAAADGLLVLGSSLQVFSGYRFCRLAVELGKPLVILNEGITRADEIATLKASTDALRLFRQTVGLLTATRHAATTEGAQHA